MLLAKFNFMKKILIIVTILLIIFVLVINEEEKPSVIADECEIVREYKIVRGDSLYPLIEDGQEVEALMGYYDCNEVSRGDVVLYSHAGNNNPLIKVVRGMPGDSFALVEVDGGWNILINNESLKTSTGANYLVNGKKYQMLSLYETENILENTFLILGEITGGGVDSTSFGLVHKSSLIARVDF